MNAQQVACAALPEVDAALRSTLLLPLYACLDSVVDVPALGVCRSCEEACH